MAMKCLHGLNHFSVGLQQLCVISESDKSIDMLSFCAALYTQIGGVVDVVPIDGIGCSVTTVRSCVARTTCRFATQCDQADVPVCQHVQDVLL